MFYLNSTLNFGIPPVLVFQLEVYYKVDRFLTGLTAQQNGSTAQWYSNKTSLHLCQLSICCEKSQKKNSYPPPKRYQSIDWNISFLYCLLYRNFVDLIKNHLSSLFQYPIVRFLLNAKMIVCRLGFPLF